MSPQLANMIAAGEVVEHPQHVIKELVENAIDANASRIKIDIVDEGLTKICVEDDGHGMDKDDLEMAILRHATSKIFEIKDLSNMKSLGFRGEALAAIASVSKMNITSKTSDASTGLKLTSASGIIQSIVPQAMNLGTKVEIEQLFYNTPARFKFMKSSYQQQKHVRQLFMELALSHPNIAFELIENDKPYKYTTGSNDVMTCIEELYGSKIASMIQHIKTEISHTTISLYVGLPDLNFSTKYYMHMFVNQRYIKHYGIQDSLLSGYEHRLMLKRYPFTLCYITIDPSRIDVNIHPQKMHVKLTNESVLAFHIQDTIKNFFNQQSRPIVRPMQVIDDHYQVQSLSFDTPLEEPREPTQFPTKIPDLSYVGMIGGTYGIFQHHEGMYLIDAHAAQERVRYEYYQHQFDILHPIKIQRLIPYPFLADTSTIEKILQLKDLFKSYYFDISEEGVHAHPQSIKEDDIHRAVDIISTHQSISMAEFRDMLAKDISCKGSIKANQKISQQEFEHLLKELNKCDEPYHCPHGRPTMIALTYYDIEKMFKRIVS